MSCYCLRFEYGAWKNASLDWVEDRVDGAVEVVATRNDGVTLAIEHTIIQPFEGEKFDSGIFSKALGGIEGNPELIIPGRALDVLIPVGSIGKGADWNVVGQDLLLWLKQNRARFVKEGTTVHHIGTGRGSKALTLSVEIHVRELPGMPGACLIGRTAMPPTMESVVRTMLTKKLAKLVGTPADIRILLLEKDQVALPESRIYQLIQDLSPEFPELSRVDQICFADTCARPEERYISFQLLDNRGLVERIAFEDGKLKTRRDDRGKEWRN